jgi:hypothetical protein
MNDALLDKLDLRAVIKLILASVTTEEEVKQALLRQEARERRELRLRSALYLRTIEAAYVAGVSAGTFRQYIAPHLKPKYLTRSTPMWRRADIVAYMDSLPEVARKVLRRSV